jgi:hypothetical protein
MFIKLVYSSNRRMNLNSFIYAKKQFFNFFVLQVDGSKPGLPDSNI